ncbi:MAG: hypothetical protein VCD31_18055 [Alphaproteobacteria bacterium]
MTFPFLFFLGPGMRGAATAEYFCCQLDQAPGWLPIRFVIEFTHLSATMAMNAIEKPDETKV